MKFEDFKEKIVNYIKENADSINDKMSDNSGYSYRNMYPFRHNDEGIEVHWTTGGMEGGNCWNDNGPYAFTVEAKEQDFWIDLILELACPNIPYLKYKSLKSEILKETNERFYEYYGNCTYVHITRLNYRHFYNVLFREELL